MKEWENAVLKISDKEIPIQGIQYTPTPFPRWEYYFRRKNKYYFRNKIGTTMIIESNDELPIKKGQLMDLELTGFN